MSKDKYLVVILVLLSILISCTTDDRENGPQITEPEVFTISAKIDTNGGVKLLGSYDTNGNAITEIGFEYSLDSLFNTKTILNSALGSNNEIEYFLVNGIKEKTRYFYKAFAKSPSRSFFGETKSFVWNGGAAPEINSISDEFGVLADTLEIRGRYFKDDNYQTLLDFSEVGAEIISLNDSIIKCKVPLDLNNVENEIRIRIDNREDSYSSFTLLKPQITSITPLNATFRDEITIIGDNFDFEISRNKVYFGNVEATITYADRNTLKVIVPDDLESSSEPIKVVAQLQEVLFGENFELIPPEITFVPQDVNVNQEINIEGANFHPILANNKITIENIEVNLTSGSTRNLETKIPLGPFPRRKAIVKIQLLDLIVEYEIELNILDKWVMVSNNLPFRFYRSINNAGVANNQAFVIAPSSDINDNNFYLWKFDPVDFSWAQSTIPFTMKWSAVLVSNGNKIYVYNAESNNGFWEYNPMIEQWSQLTAYPGARRDYPTHFSINGDIYIGMGADFEPYTSIKYGDFYKYSPTTNSWTQIADFTYQNYFLRTETSTFTINEIAYVGNGATNTGMVDYWSYHPNMDEWIRIADFNDSRRYTASFELNGYGYVTGGTPTGGSNRNDCWRYDPTADNWTQADDIGPIVRAGHFSFSINGKGYVGGGIWSISATRYDMYEFIP